MKIENLQQLKEIIINEIKPYIIDKGTTPWQFNINKQLFQKLNKKYDNWFKNIMELLYLNRNYNNLENCHIYCYCGNKNNFWNSHYGYKHYCSHHCVANSKEYWEKREITSLIRYNEKHYTNRKKAIMTGLNNIDENGLNAFKRGAKKAIQTKLNTIDENGLNTFQRVMKINIQNIRNNIDKNGLNGIDRMIIKMKQTKKLRYGNENYNNREKSRKTFLERYNGTSSFNSKILREKAKQTMLNDIDKNGLNIYQITAIKAKNTKLNTIDKNGLNIYQKSTIKAKQTNLQKYKVDSYTKTQECKNKIKQKSLLKYGVEHHTKTLKFRKYIQIHSYFKTQQFKDLFKNKEWLDKVKQKEYETKKKNNSFTKSKPEDYCYNLLLQKFNKDDIERQYRSKLYPFNCDFYIKSLDVYIECNFSQYHYNKPFKHSVEDMEIIEEFKKKSKEINFKGERKLQYLNIIDTWTRRDPLKLQTFKKNKLNYKIFYSIEQFLNWYNKI